MPKSARAYCLTLRQRGASLGERVHAELARAQAEGKLLGRPTVGEEKEVVGVGTSVVQRVRATMMPGDPVTADSA